MPTLLPSPRLSECQKLAMSKQAGAIGAITGGETGFEKAMGGLSFVPGIGFLGNLGQGASQLVRGHPWKALGSAALGVGSFFTGGAANDAVKGIGAASRIGHMAATSMPTFNKGFQAVKNFSSTIRGTKPFQTPTMQRIGQGLEKNYSPWVNGGTGSAYWHGPKDVRSYTGMGKQMIGRTAVDSFTEGRDAASMAPKNRMFDTAMGAGNTASNLMGGESDPRWLEPKSMPAPFTPMFQ